MVDIAPEYFPQSALNRDSPVILWRTQRRRAGSEEMNELQPISAGELVLAPAVEKVRSALELAGFSSENARRACRPDYPCSRAGASRAAGAPLH